MKKKRLNIGACQDNYHRLFLDRLNREGRADAFYKRRSALYHSDEWQNAGKHWDQTWWPVAREFGFISKLDELERYEEFMLHGTVLQRQRELRAMQEEIKKEQAEEELQSVLDELGNASDLDLPADIAWVYNHPAMLRKGDKDGFVELSVKDMQGAPGKGAVGMLQYFVNKKPDFYKLVLAHLSKKSVAGKEDSTLEDDLRQADEIAMMLGVIDAS